MPTLSLSAVTRAMIDAAALVDDLNEARCPLQRAAGIDAGDGRGADYSEPFNEEARRMVGVFDLPSSAFREERRSAHLDRGVRAVPGAVERLCAPIRHGSDAAVARVGIADGRALKHASATSCWTTRGLAIRRPVTSQKRVRSRMASDASCLASTVDSSRR
uniref:hypothetical protein n=1 Tax=Cupriavidus necator TaxID=106590 RepID=UPI003FA4AE69